MLTYAYDIECLKNLFTVIFVNVDDENDKHFFYIGLDKKDYKDIKKFLSKEIILVGYNNISYDDPMLRYLSTYRGANIVKDLYDLSSKLVDDNYRRDRTILSLRYPKTGSFLWHSIDLMTILGFNKLGVSLKQASINLKWHRIQDMPIDHRSKITKEQLETIFDYNLNDVLITKRLYEEIAPLRNLRKELSKLYHVDLMSASDSKIANIILEHIYSEERGINASSLKDMRTNRNKVLLGDCIPNFIEFKSPQLKELLDRISSTYVYKYNRYHYTEEINFANCTFSLGIGGLHTKDLPGVFKSNDKFLIQDADVASYYPNLIINNNFYPQHLGESFIHILKKITDERINAKKTGDKVKADGLKITINSIFGKLGYEYFWLYDPKQMLATTVTGQLALLMLAEQMHLYGIHVLSANTDGVVCSIPRELIDTYNWVAEEWCKKTGLELEFVPYKKYVRRDVNSYITQKLDGKTKEKGVFVRDIQLKRAYNMPIVPKALYNYFIEDIPIRETLENCKDIMEFCMSQKTGSNFVTELHTNQGVETLQKTNRYYVSNHGGTLIKRNFISDRTTGMNVGYQVRILNDYDPEVPFEDYDVNIGFYEEEVMKIVDEISPRQISLFDLNQQDWGTSTKMEAKDASREIATEPKTIHELQKLGKNQLMERIQRIVTQKEKIERISPRYVYVKGFNSRNMMADVYCLSKGVSDSLKVSKEKYESNGLNEGDLIYCDKFEKTVEGHVISDYRRVQELEEDKNWLWEKG